MVSIQPIGNDIAGGIKRLQNRFAEEEIRKFISGCSIPITAGAVVGNFGFSDKCKNFQKTIADNFFQLKIDPKTGYPYEPDVFQTTSANHLFLGDDVIVTAPTGTGKTAIAEYIITKNLREGKRTFYTTPLKALSNEKYRDFQKIYGKNNVGLMTGDIKINTGAPIVLMTTEVYRNMATSAYFSKEKNMPKELRTVIFDELQYLGDVDRGGVWETSIMLTPSDVQILSLSATAKNAEQINNWIAKIRHERGFKANTDGQYHANPTNYPRSAWIEVPSQKRHVPLDITLEHVVPDGNKKATAKSKKKSKDDTIKNLGAKTNFSTYKTITKNLEKQDKLPAIYFIFSKKDSRALLKYFEEYGDTLTTPEEKASIQNIVNIYKTSDRYLGETLNINALIKGYAIHNAGMLPVQKELVEELFQKKLLKVAIATETLSAGINMPAKTTVITAIRKPATISDNLHDGKRNLTPNEFHQMAGRAGRRGIDTHGYCLPLSCNKSQTNVINELIASPSNNLESNFKFDYAFVANYMSKYDNLEEMRNFAKRTFFAQSSEHKVNSLIKEFKHKRDILYENNFIDKNGLTIKGELLKSLNGYEQIPVINFIGDGKLNDLNNIELAAIIGGMANIQYKDLLKAKKIEDQTAFTNETLNSKVDELEDELIKYSSRMQEIYPNFAVTLNQKAIRNIYEWANENSLDSDSRENWKKLVTDTLKDSIRDEGTFFKELTVTIDLMKQMVDICKTGIKYSNTEKEKEYYTNLQNKLYECISLLQKEPVIEEITN